MIFALSNGYDSRYQIDIVHRQMQGLGNPKPTAREKPNQGSVGLAPKALGGSQLCRRLHQLLDLVGRVNKRGRSTVGRTESVPWREFGVRIKNRQILGKPPDQLESFRPLKPLSVPWQSSPPNGKVSRQ